MWETSKQHRIMKIICGHRLTHIESIFADTYIAQYRSLFLLAYSNETKPPYVFGFHSYLWNGRSIKGSVSAEISCLRMPWHSRPKGAGTSWIFSERELAFTIAICYQPSVCCLSVVCLSVCLWRWCTLLRRLNFSAIFFHHTIAQGLYSSGAKNRWWGTPLSPEICVQSDPPPLKQRNFDQ